MKFNKTLDFLNKQYLSLDIQYFAETESPSESTESTNSTNPTTTNETNHQTDSNESSPNEPSKPKEKMYTQEELEEIVKQRVAREKKAAEKAVQEAEKLAKMNEEQKRQYELEKLQKELEEYKRKDAFNTMSKEASKMLAEHEIIADERVLSFVVKETADETKETVNAFVDLIKEKVQEGVKKALAGTTPKKSNSQNGSATSKEEIMKEKDPIKRQKLIKENIHLFKS